MKNIKGGYGGLAVAVLLALFVLAAIPAGADQQTAAKTQQQTMQTTMRASDMLDKSVKNHQNETVGEVDDLILSRTGKIQYVVLSVGGFLGIGDKLVAVPFNYITTSHGGGLMYDVTKDKLENTREFKYEDYGLDRDMAARYGMGPYGTGGYGPGYGPGPYGPGPYGRDYYGRGPAYGNEGYGRNYPDDRYRDGSKRVAVRAPDRMRASWLIGKEIVNPRGEDIGEVNDLLITHDGRVANVVVDVGGFLGMGQKHVIQSFQSLKMDQYGEFMLNTTKDSLKKAPEYKKG